MKSTYEWQPIETAPLSNFSTPVRLLFWGRKFGIAFGRVYDGGDHGIHAVVDGYHGDWEPTHWMPLPPAPEKNDE